MKQIDCVNKNVLNYYGVSKCNDSIVIDTAEEYIDKFLKRYVLNGVGNGKNKKEFVFRGLSKGEQRYSKITRQYYMNDLKCRH